MEIFYLISSLMLIICFLLIYKNEKKLNLLVWIILTIAIFLCYNNFIVYVLHYIKIKSSLLNLSIINLIISCLLFYFIHKKKKYQKYYFKYSELICCSIIIIIVCIIGYIRFHNLSQISFETTDPALHYKIALKYSETNDLLDKINSIDELYTNFDNHMPGSYINCGIFIRIFKFIPSYYVFICNELFMYAIYGLVFFATGLIMIKKEKNLILLTLTSLFYLLGYPLSNLIFGFCYLGVGVYIINLIVLLYLLFKNDLNNMKKLFIFLLFLFNYNLFFSYYLFIPAVYLSEGIFIIYLLIKREINLKKFFLFEIFGLFFPFVLGMIHFIIPGFLAPGLSSSSSALASEGYIYRNLFMNFIILMPIFIYSFIQHLRSKEKKFELFLMIILALYTLFILFLGMKGRASSYYYYKLYYPLWLLYFIIILKSLCDNKLNNKLYIYSNYFVLIFLLIMCATGLEFKVQQNNVNFNPYIVTNNVIDIYTWNHQRLFEKRYIFNSDEIEIMEKSKKLYKCVYNNEFPMIGSFLQKLWYYSETDIVPVYNHLPNNLMQIYDDSFDYEGWNNDSKSKCLIIFYSSNNKDNENYIKIDYDNYEKLYSNKSGIIIMKKNK